MIRGFLSTATVPVIPSFLPAEMLLGGEEVLHAHPRTSLEWIEVVRKGISAKSIGFVIKYVRVSQSELASSLGIPERTLIRRKRDGVLNTEESSKIVRMARVVERAGSVFNSIDAAISWLKTPVSALSGATPLSLLDTDIGAESVMDTLGRIEHGVFA